MKQAIVNKTVMLYIIRSSTIASIPNLCSLYQMNQLNHSENAKNIRDAIQLQGINEGGKEGKYKSKKRRSYNGMIKI